MNSLLPFGLFLFLILPSAGAQSGCSNLVLNGDFSDGYNSFSSDLDQSCACTAGTHCVAGNFQEKCAGWPSLGDHGGGGSFLIVDGSPVAAIDVWSQAVAVTQGVSYHYSFWVASVYPQPFTLGITINGALVGGPFTVSQPTPGWVNYTGNWTSTVPGVNIPVLLAIRQLTGGGQRDFGIDDIEFQPSVSAAFVVTSNGPCELNRKFASQSVGPGSLTYAWDFGDPASGPLNTSTQQNPTHVFSACGPYEVCLTATSPFGCSAQACQQINVDDITPPVITCPASLTVPYTPPDCAEAVNGLQWLTATDECGAPTVAWQITGATVASGTGNASGMTFNYGASVLRYTATDKCGNTRTCSLTVTLSATESCNGLDDDCDGLVDEGFDCPTPTGLTVTPVSDTSVSVSWDVPPGSCVDTMCIVRIEEDTNGVFYYSYHFYPATPPDPNPTLTIVPGLNYVFFAMSLCGNEVSEHSDSIFIKRPCLVSNPCAGSLVTNGSFEAYNGNIPTALDQIDYCPGWNSPTMGPNTLFFGDWYSNKPGGYFGYYESGFNQITLLTAACGYDYAGFGSLMCEGISTALTGTIAPNAGYEVSFLWTPSRTATYNGAFVGILSAAPCTLTHPFGSVCGHVCGGDFHVVVPVTTAHQAGTWYRHSFTGKAPMAANRLTFAPMPGAGSVAYIYIDEVCVRTYLDVCNVGKPRITYDPAQPHAFYGDAELGPGSTLVSAVWDFGDGSVDSSSNPGAITHAFDAPGEYTVCLTVTAVDTAGTTCSDSSCIQVVITQAAGKCDQVGVFWNQALTGDCCYDLASYVGMDDCFTQINLTLNSGDFTSSTFSPNLNAALNGSQATLTPAGSIPFLPAGPEAVATICTPNGTEPYTLGVDFVYAGGVCHQEYEFQCYDTCSCEGFSDLEFAYGPGPTYVWQLPATCGNTTPVDLPCVPFDALYRFKGKLNCSNDCTSQVGFELFEGTQSLGSGFINTTGSGLFDQQFQNYGPGTYTLVLNGLCGANQDSCECVITFTICEPCTAAFTVNAIDPCGHVMVAATGSGATPITYQWAGASTATTPTLDLQLPCGTHTLALTATCANGATGTATQSIVVTDNQPPTIACPQSQTVGTDPGLCTYAFLPPPLFVLDNCDPNPVLTCSWEDPTGTILPLTGPVLLDKGVTTIRCTATDKCNNTSTLCLYTIAVTDQEPPQIICPPNLTVQGSLGPTGQCFATVNGLAPTVTDNCPLMSLTYTVTGGTNGSGNDDASGSFSDISTVTYTAVDMGNTTTACSFTVTVDCSGDPCCLDTAAFLAVATAVQTFGTLGDCSLSFQAVGLNPCMRITYDWDDNTTSGPFADNVPVTHTYGGPGTYNVCYTIEQVDAAGVVCGSYQHCEPVDVLCIDCGCGTFTELTARPSPGGPPFFMSCGQTTMLGCPPTGYSLPITGKFECQGADCAAETTVSWTLLAPGNVQYSGTVTASPYFYLPILPAQYAQPGTYTLILNGACGFQTCPPCTTSFAINCPDPCPCDQAQFLADVAKSFSHTLYATSCKGCFTPVALNDCDEVEWFVNNVSVGTAGGTQTFCHAFATAGTYTVKMLVTRRKSDGTICAQKTRMKTILVTCAVLPPCDDPIVANPRFNEGAVPGGINSTGASAGWYGPCGEPVVVEGEPGSLDGWTIELTGNLDSADVLAPLDAICLAKDTGTVSLRFGIREKGIKATLHVQLYQGDDFEMGQCDGVSCLPLAAIDLSDLDTGWADLVLPYDLRDWAAPDTCPAPGDTIAFVPVRVAIFVTTALGSGQPGGDVPARVQLDNFCMDGRALQTLCFSSLALSVNGGSGTPLTCGNTYNIGCPYFNVYKVTWNFGICFNTSMSYILYDPSNGITSQGSSSTLAFLDLPPFVFTTSGLYRLVLTGYCGQYVCPCTIYFNVKLSCPTPCSGCNPQQFQQQVDQGFYTTVQSFPTCRVCFKPKALQACDQIFWSVSGYPDVYTIGNQPACYNLPAGGASFNVTWVATRLQPPLVPCATKTKTFPVAVSCFNIYNCTTLRNFGFDSLGTPGVLGAGGASANWLTVAGTPRIDTLPGDPFNRIMTLSGNADASDVVRTYEELCLDKTSGTLRVRLRSVNADGQPAEPKAGETLVVQLVRGDQFLPGACSDTSCYELGRIELDSGLLDDWADVSVAYDLTDVPGLDSCGNPEPSLRGRLVLYVLNVLPDTSGPDSRSHLQLDAVCFDGPGSAVGVAAPASVPGIRIYPNPTTGALTAELSEPARYGLVLRVTDPTGRRLLERRAETGATAVVMPTGTLPAGLYFLQVMAADGRVLTSEKFVKQ